MERYKGVVGLPKAGQSPVDLNDKVLKSRRYPPLLFTGHWLQDGEAVLSNTGEKVVITLRGERIPSTLRGGPLKNDEYEFHSLEFHWGQDNCRGADHTINGTWFSMEAHAIHWNKKYRNFDECMNHKDGMCIVSYLFLVKDGPCELQDPKFERITSNLKYIIKGGSETKIPSNSLYWMRAATNCSTYYVYPGSYNNESSYPECAICIVFPLILPILPCQINQFRQLEDHLGRKIKSNWRETQRLKGRRIYLATP